ncbi:MAG: GNAT family N-acetyltransferase [Leptospirales bacterium]
MSETSKHEAVIRKALESDVDAIYQIIQPFAVKQILLPRTRQEISSDIVTTWIIEKERKVVATATLVPYENKMYEIRALAVRETAQNQGFGAQIVDYIFKEIKKLKRGKFTVFALTYSPVFFQKLGMRIVEKNNFPQKIFDACRMCPHLDDCSEIAVEITL